MTAGPADTDSCSEPAALLRERLQRLVDSLDKEQIAAISDLVSMLERLTALLDETTHH